MGNSVIVWVGGAKDFLPRGRYVLAILCECLGFKYRLVDDPTEVPNEGPLLGYGPSAAKPVRSGPTVWIHQSSAAVKYFRQRRPFNVAQVSWQQVEQELVPVLFPGENGTPHDPGVVADDIVASAFYFLTGWDDYVVAARDRWERLPYAFSLHAALGTIQSCPVDGYAAMLLAAWQTVWPTCHIHRQPAWPEGQPFAVCLTHDVDQVHKWSLRRILGASRQRLRELGQGRLRDTWRELTADLLEWLGRRQPYWTFPEIVAGEQARSARSTFYFLVPTLGGRSVDYDVAEPRVSALLAELQAAGWEVGWHGIHVRPTGGQRYEDQLRYLRAVAGTIAGVRQDYLQLQIPASYMAQESLELAYDASLGFAEALGWRSGWSYPFHPYNLAEERPFDLLELPLVVMDRTLIKPDYLDLTAEAAWEAVRTILERTARTGGLCTLLWHNEFFDSRAYPGYAELYWRILDRVKQAGGWMPTAAAVCEWWTRRCQPLRC